MKVIMLTGKANSGKTTALHRVFDIIFEKTDKSSDIIIPKTFTENGDDFWAAIRYNGKTVYFYSLGDLAGEICDAMKTALEQNYDICVCCSKLHFKAPFKFIEKNNLDAYYIEKGSPTDTDTNQVVNKLIYLITESTK